MLRFRGLPQSIKREAIIRMIIIGVILSLSAPTLLRAVLYFFVFSIFIGHTFLSGAQAMKEEMNPSSPK